MKRRTIVEHSIVSIAALAALTACAGSGSKSGSKSLRRVDDLLDQIERVHVNSELSMERMHDALDNLHMLAAPDFDGDAVAVFSQYVEAVGRSEKQADELRKSIVAMKKAADTVFDQWEADLQSFSNSKMRQRSRERLDETRQRYDAILDAVEPARSAYDILNVGMRDQAVFLGHDFNADAVADVADEVRALTKLVAELDGRFDATQAAAEAYVRSKALPGQLETQAVADEAPEERPAAKKNPGPKKAGGGARKAGGGGAQAAGGGRSPADPRR